MKEESFDFQKQLELAAQVGMADFEVNGQRFFLLHPEASVSSNASFYRDGDPLLKPPLRRQAYSDRTAWLMSTLADLAYTKFEDGPRNLDKLIFDLGLGKMSLLKTFDSEIGTQAILVRRKDEFRALVFRGTESIKDVRIDIRAEFSAAPPYGRVHLGFIQAYKAVAEAVTTALRDTEGEEPLFIAGHSLGGALATVATRHLEDTHLISATYTFGSPRVGDEQWADSLKTPIYRVVNRSDPVPLAPASGVLKAVLTAACGLWGLGWLRNRLDIGYMGYQHVGDIRFLSDEGPGQPHLKSGSSATVARFKHMLSEYILKPATWLALPEEAADHSIKKYSDRLRTIATLHNPQSTASSTPPPA